jgi:hypothetical protein
MGDPFRTIFVVGALLNVSGHRTRSAFGVRRLVIPWLWFVADGKWYPTFDQALQ